MTKLTVTAAFLATLFAACSSSDPPACKSSDSFICSDDLGAFPFVRAALAVSDLCVGSPEGNPIGDTMSCTGAIIPDGETTVTLTQPEAGRLCLAGRVSTSGFALISLSLSEASADQRTNHHALRRPVARHRPGGDDNRHPAKPGPGGGCPHDPPPRVSGRRPRLLLSAELRVPNHHGRRSGRGAALGVHVRRQSHPAARHQRAPRRLPPVFPPGRSTSASTSFNFLDAAGNPVTP